MRQIVLTISVMVLIVGLFVWREVALWQECRATPHSFFYCARVLGGSN